MYLSERNIYGSSRIGMEQVGQIIASQDPGNVVINEENGIYSGVHNLFTQNIGDKRFELSNHLGNVLEVITDRKIPIDFGVYDQATGGYTSSTADGIIDYYSPDVISQNDYYPFGMLLPNRHESSAEYRYGFNGMEKDDEVSGEGNSYTAEYWQYDSRLGRRWNIDPVVKEFESPYAAFSNSPLVFIDPNGDDWFYYQKSGEDEANYHWHEGSILIIRIADDNNGNAQYQSVEAHKAVVVFDGSRDEHPGVNNSFTTAGAVNAKVTFYKSDGTISSYDGYTMTSNPNKYSPIDEGIYKISDRGWESGSHGMIKRLQVDGVDGKDIKTMDNEVNKAYPEQGDVKTEIVTHNVWKTQKDLDGLGKSMSSGCLLISNKNGQYDDFLQSMIKEKEATLIVNRDGSDHNPNLNPPVEYTPSKTLIKPLEILINFVKKDNTNVVIDQPRF